MTEEPPENRRLWLVTILTFVGLEAVGFQMRGALVPELKQQFAVSASMLGLVAPAGTVGFVLCVVVMGTVAGRVNMKRFLLVGSLIVSACMFVMGLAPTFVAFLGALFVRGVATGLFRGLDRPILSHLYPTSRGRIFNMYDLAWAVGATIGPLLVTASVAAGSWQFAYLGLAVTFVPVAILVSRTDLPLEPGTEEELDLGALRHIIRKTGIVGMAVAMFIGGGVEGGIFTWLPYYVGKSFSQSSANSVLSLFLVSYVPGRLVYTYISERVQYINLVITIGVLLVPTAYVVFSTSTWVVLLAGIALMGVLQSGIYPNMVAFGVETSPEFSGPVNAIATSAFYAGMASFPVLMGFIADYRDIFLSMKLIIVLATLFASIVVVTKLVDQRTGQSSVPAQG
ncbi:sugar MFS transporter [Halorussus sp. MSC15.2]|uniref:MFS transporter n=1 Tax=Halorussus sp. MSC15.2 TaxID=2283638 RepID=UPI0013D0B5F6|nr:MFS transporter [Halorussus sp. MSC15.2]NEU59110.1 MFS transporter [Halorussus sp. MSC15.2]